VEKLDKGIDLKENTHRIVYIRQQPFFGHPFGRNPSKYLVPITFIVNECMSKEKTRIDIFCA
jgi:hypothetical protein